MNETQNTVLTIYGRLDAEALSKIRSNYDTSKLLRIVDDLDRVISTFGGQDGLRDMLLQLHGMAHTVINGAGISASTQEDTLPELASEFIGEVEELISSLKAWVAQIEPLEQLAVRN